MRTLYRSKYDWKRIGRAAAPAMLAALLPGCAGTPLPPVTVTLDVVQGVEIPAVIVATGSADVPLAPICGLFDEEDLDAMVREAAGDLIADFVIVTGVDLEATHIDAVEGTFAPFTDAALSLTILEPGGETLLLGDAADGNGLGTAFDMTKTPPVDLLNDLDADQCSSPTLHLDGGAPLEPRDITFDVRATVVVSLEIR